MPIIIDERSSLETVVRWQRPGANGAGYASGVDNVSRTVRVMGSGRWSEFDAERYFNDQRRLVAAVRARFGVVKVSFDVRDWVVDDDRSALQFQAMNREIFEECDRLVALVRCSVSKQHPRTALGIGTREAFLSPSAAETWLQAYSVDCD